MVRCVDSIVYIVDYPEFYSK